MNKKELDYLIYLATQNLTAYDYKILLLLLEKPYNQASIAEILNTKRQNIYKCFKGLEAKKLIEVDREEGRNKYYRAVTDLIQLQTMLPGQMKVNL